MSLDIAVQAEYLHHEDRGRRRVVYAGQTLRSRSLSLPSQFRDGLN